MTVADQSNPHAGSGVPTVYSQMVDETRGSSTEALKPCPKATLFIRGGEKKASRQGRGCERHAVQECWGRKTMRRPRSTGDHRATRQFSCEWTCGPPDARGPPELPKAQAASTLH